MTSHDAQDSWVEISRKQNKLLFSEMDVLLRALDRFFHVENLLTPVDGLTNKNFFEELTTARDALLRVLGILEVIIPESRKNAFWFQKFAETKFMSDRKRDALREDISRQDSPEKALYRLYDGFINLKVIISDLVRSGNISYLSFSNIGNMVSKEIRENTYFNPFMKNINPEFDVISNRDISEIVRMIPDKEMKKNISVIYLYLYRIMRFISFVDISTQRTVALNASLIILILLRSEIQMFQAHIDKAARKIKNPEMEMLLKSLAYQFSMETRRVYSQELKDIYRKKISHYFRGKIENSHGILRNMTEQSIVQITNFFRPDLKGEDIFASFTTKLEQSLRLREDIMVLHEILTLLEKKKAHEQVRAKIFESMKNYMLYFESFTFRLLRHDDYEEFAKFSGDITTVKKEDIPGDGFGKIFDRMMYFKIFLETTLRHIANRAELSGKEADIDRVKSMLHQYL